MVGGVKERPVGLVTGASTGIGKATANQLLDDGYTVYSAARRVERMQGLAACGAHVFEMEMTNDAQIVEGIEQIVADCSRVDVLVNNAGYGAKPILFIRKWASDVVMDWVMRMMARQIGG